MDGRLTIGPPNSSFANVSALPANIYVGYNAKVVFGESISVGPGVNIIVKDNASLEVGVVLKNENLSRCLKKFI